MSTAALSHLRVVDLTHHIAGPYCTKLLADFGADALKIARPGGGDDALALGPFLDDRPSAEGSGTFAFLNTNKRSICVDLKTDAGRDVVRRLVQDADIVVENFRPGVLERLDLGHQCLQSINPRLVMTSISNFGQTGPNRDFRATEIVADAMSGWMYGLGTPDREPIKPPGAQAQLVGGMYGLTATLTAIFARQFSGRGQYVDVSIQEAVLWMMMNITTTYSYSGQVWQRDGGHSTMNAPQGIYECKDGLIGINVIYYVEWPRFAEFVGQPEWLEDPRFATPVERARNRPAMDEVLVPWIRQQSKQDLYERAQRAKIPFALVNSPADLLESPQLQARDYWARVGEWTMPGAPFKLPETPWQIRRPAPRLGEHTDEALEGVGFSAAEVAELRSTGAVA